MQVVGYFGSWAYCRNGRGKFDIENIDPTLCTTLIYAFVGIDGNTFTVRALDQYHAFDKGGLREFVDLKRQNPRLKVLVAVGGWNEGSEKYSRMAATRANRKAFIDSAVQFIRNNRFDGLDLDWEYPASRGGQSQDKQNFVTLVQELRREFDKYGWTLTAAMAAGKATIEAAYDIRALSRELDFMHIMAYDYHGMWDVPHRTGHHAPLYSRSDEGDKSLNVDATIRHYLSCGAPRNKLVLGIGLYGRTFCLSNSANPDIGAPTQSSGFKGPYTQEDGMMGYNEICEKLATEGGRWKVVRHNAHKVPYMYRDNMWVGYDDETSVRLKASYARQLGLGGVMVWSVETDDFTGITGNRFPLLRAINQAL